MNKEEKYPFEEGLVGCAYGAPFASPSGPPVEANLFLIDVGPNKIKVITYLRSLLVFEGLSSIKDLIETPNALLFEEIYYGDAQKFKKLLEELGATVDLQETRWMNDY